MKVEYFILVHSRSLLNDGVIVLIINYFRATGDDSAYNDSSIQHKQEFLKYFIACFLEECSDLILPCHLYIFFTSIILIYKSYILFLPFVTAAYWIIYFFMAKVLKRGIGLDLSIMNNSLIVIFILLKTFGNFYMICLDKRVGFL